MKFAITHTNKIICAAVYIITFSIIMHYNLTNQITGDVVREFHVYLQNIDVGWQFIPNEMVNSSIVSTLLPAWLHNIFGIEILLSFRIIPAIFYPLMPVFAYLIARKYMDWKQALFAPLVIIMSSSILFFPDMGRVGIALGFMAGVIWALLNQKIYWVIIFGILVIFSHYGTAAISLGAIVVAIFGETLSRKKIPYKHILMLVLLLSIFFIWHFGIAQVSGQYMGKAISGITSIPRQSIYAQELERDEEGRYINEVGELIDSLDFDTITSIKARDEVARAAFGYNWSIRSTPLKIEIIANWIIVAAISLGLIVMLRRKVDIQYKLLLLSFYGLILFTLAIPYLSISYGVQRVYFTTSILLASCFYPGVEAVSRKIKIPTILSALFLLTIYGLSTSGMIYRLFSLVKTL